MTVLAASVGGGPSGTWGKNCQNNALQEAYLRHPGKGSIVTVHLRYDSECSIARYLLEATYVNRNEQG